MGYDTCVRIDRAENGYTLSMKDQAAVEANMKRSMSKKYDTPYVEERKEYVFADYASLEKFLKANLEKALPKANYESTFAAISQDD